MAETSDRADAEEHWHGENAARTTRLHAGAPAAARGDSRTRQLHWLHITAHYESLKGGVGEPYDASRQEGARREATELLPAQDPTEGEQPG